MKKLRIGILGAGHIGSFHIQQTLEIQTYELVGIYDPNPEKARIASEKYNVIVFDSMDELIDNVDIVDVVTPTLSHFKCASKALRKFKHVFIEKPLTSTIEEARILLNLVEEADVKVQVGHVERFNPAFTEAQKHINNPRFIEAHRLSVFNPRGTDVPVVLDLMIHDIDIILSVVDSPVKKISANGVTVVSKSADIANARLEFANGCVANITASRISMKNMRRSRFFQNEAYIAVDFLEKSTEIVTLRKSTEEPGPFDFTLNIGDGNDHLKVGLDKPEIAHVNAIREELISFSNSIKNNTDPPVTIEDGVNALEVAFQILNLIEKSS